MRKKQLLFLLFLVSLCLSLNFVALAASNANTIVYVAPNSEKYHSWVCHYLDESIRNNTVRSLTLEHAVTNSYVACTVCDPPKANFPYTITGDIEQPDASDSSSYTYHTNNSETHTPLTPSSNQYNNNTFVYLSDDNTCYHTKYCSFSPDNKVHLYYAATHGYTACDLCNPSEPNFEYTVSSTPQVSFGSRVVDIILTVLYWLGMALLLSPVFFAWILPLLVKLVSAILSLFARKPKPPPPPPPPPPIPGMPDDTTLDLNGLPREKNCNGTAPWGDKYTVWYSKNGSKYHTFWCEWRSDIPVNVVNIDREPCRVCRPKLPDLEWYYKYKSAESDTNGSTLAPSEEGAGRS